MSDTHEIDVAIPAASDKTADLVRWSVRDVRRSAGTMAAKASKASGTPIGIWVSEAIEAKFHQEREKNRLPATIGLAHPPANQVLAITPTKEPDEVYAHLAVLDTVCAFAADGMSESVRHAADRVIVDRLRLLRRPQPRKPRGTQRQPRPAHLSDSAA